MLQASVAARLVVQAEGWGGDFQPSEEHIKKKTGKGIAKHGLVASQASSLTAPSVSGKRGKPRVCG